MYEYFHVRNFLLNQSVEEESWEAEVDEDYRWSVGDLKWGKYNLEKSVIVSSEWLTADAFGTFHISWTILLTYGAESASQHIMMD